MASIENDIIVIRFYFNLACFQLKTNSNESKYELSLWLFLCTSFNGLSHHIITINPLWPCDTI